MSLLDSFNRYRPSTAEKYALHKKAISYNLSGIISEQKSMHDKYKH